MTIRALWEELRVVKNFKKCGNGVGVKFFEILTKSYQIPSILSNVIKSILNHLNRNKILSLFSFGKKDGHGAKRIQELALTTAMQIVAAIQEASQVIYPSDFFQTFQYSKSCMSFL
jgi:hypothetical protein